MNTNRPSDQYRANLICEQPIFTATGYKGWTLNRHILLHFVPAWAVLHIVLIIGFDQGIGQISMLSIAMNVPCRRKSL